MIPNNVFQTHKSLNYILNNSILNDAQKSWQNNNYNYYFYDDTQCDNFMYKNFPEIKDAYDSLPIRVMKADLWRYCILYKYGGIYADSDTVLLKYPSFFTNNNDNIHFVVTPENDTHLCQWCFASVANSPILKSIIDLSVERIRETKIMSGQHLIHYLTGPAVFTDGILKYLNDQLTYNIRRSHCPKGLTQLENPYVKIKIGSSDNNTKTIKLDKNIKLDKKLFILSKDTFSQLTNKDELIIKRTDTNTGWNENLIAYQFNCIKNIMIIPSNIFHNNCILHKFSGQWDNGWCKEWNQKNKLVDIFNLLENHTSNLYKKPTTNNSNNNDKLLQLIQNMNK